jgi:hypothetical protein
MVSKMAELKYLKKQIGIFLAVGLLPLMASCGGGGGTSIKAAPENLLPIVEAVTSSTFSSWESASSVFSSGSTAEKKWTALKSQQRYLFENGDAESMYFWTSDEKDGWDVLKFCSDPIVDNECSEFDKSPEVHIKSDNDKVSDLRWFEDAADEAGSQPEIAFYQITSANPGFGAADFSIKSALTKSNQSGKAVTCYYGDIVVDSEIRSVVEEVYLPVRLYVKAETSDGVTLESTSGTSGIIDTTRVNEPIPFVACFEYPGSEIDRLTIGAGEFRMEILGSRRGNTADIAITLNPRLL